MTYVPGSAKVDGSTIAANAVTVTNPDAEGPGTGNVRIDGDWWIGILQNNHKTFSFDYIVGPTCVPGTTYTTAMHFSGTHGIGSDGGGYTGTSGNRGPSITIEKANSNTTVNVAPNPEVGATSTLTATIAPVGTPIVADSGTVEFFNNGTTMGAPVPVSGGTASLPWTPAATGGYSITAVYSGNTVFNPSTSPAVTGSVAQIDAPATAPTGVTFNSPVTEGQDVTVSGTAAADSTAAAVTIDGTEVCTTGTIAGDGTFSCTFPATADMDNQDVIVATSNAGGTSPTTNAGTLTVNEAPTVPDAPTGLALNPATAEPAETVTVTGTAAEGATIALQLDGTGVTADCTPTVVGADGQFSCTFTAPGTDGEYGITATATTAGGTSTASTAATLTVETAATAPAAPTDLVLNPDSVVEGGTVTVTGQAEPGSTIAITVDGTVTTCAPATVDTDGSFTCTFTAPGTDGTYPVIATATNTVGAGTPSAPVNLTVTDPAPGTPEAPTGLTVTPNPATAGEDITVTGTAEAGTEVTISGSVTCTVTADATTGEFSCTVPAPAAGDHSVTATASNGTNTGPASAPANFTVDAAPTAPAQPDAPTLSPASIVAGGTVAVTGTTEPGATVTVTGGSGCTTTADAVTGAYSCDITAPGTAGPVNVTVVATNAEGASDASDASVLTVTDPAPGTPDAPSGLVLEPATVEPGETVTVTGTAPEGATIVVQIDGTDITAECTPAVVGADGEFSCTFTAPGADGEYDITATATVDGENSLASIAAELTVSEGEDNGNGNGSGSLGGIFDTIFGSLGGGGGTGGSGSLGSLGGSGGSGSLGSLGSSEFEDGSSQASSHGSSQSVGWIEFQGS